MGSIHYQSAPPANSIASDRDLAPMCGGRFSCEWDDLGDLAIPRGGGKNEGLVSRLP